MVVENKTKIQTMRKKIQFSLLKIKLSTNIAENNMISNNNKILFKKIALMGLDKLILRLFKLKMVYIR